MIHIFCLINDINVYFFLTATIVMIVTTTDPQEATTGMTGHHIMTGTTDMSVVMTSTTNTTVTKGPDPAHILHVSKVSFFQWSLFMSFESE